MCGGHCGGVLLRRRCSLALTASNPVTHSLHIILSLLDRYALMMHVISTNHWTTASFCFRLKFISVWSWNVSDLWPFTFYPRNAVARTGYASVCCPSVRKSVRLSVWCDVGDLIFELIQFGRNSPRKFYGGKTFILEKQVSAEVGNGTALISFYIRSNYAPNWSSLATIRKTSIWDAVSISVFKNGKRIVQSPTWYHRVARSRRQPYLLVQTVFF